MLRHSPTQEQIRQAVQHILRRQSSPYVYRQAFPRELVNHRQESERPPVTRPGTYEVVAPDMIAPLRPQSNAGSIVQLQAPTLRLLGGNLQPLPPPDPLHPLVIHPPAFVPEKARHPPVAITAILGRQLDDVRR